MLAHSFCRIARARDREAKMMGDMFGNMSFDSSSGESGAEEEEEDLQITPDAPKLAARETEHEVGYRPRNGAPILVRQIREKGLSFQLWPAATGLCWYLEHLHGREQGGGGDGDGEGLRGIRVLELGAGTGMVGVMAGRRGAAVTLTDLPHVLPNLVSNVELNCKEVEAAGGSLDVRPLRWGVREDIAPLGAPFDLILASDCVYYDTLFDPLMQSLKWLCGVNAACSDGDPSLAAMRGDEGCVRGASPAGPLVLLAHLRRWKKDGHFFRMASKFFNVEVVHKHPPPENARIGVVVYKFTRKESLCR